MNSEIFTNLFQSFLEKNPFLLLNSTDLNNNSYSFGSESTLYNKMLFNDNQYFNALRNELNNKRILNNINNIYYLLFNNCININNNFSNKETICSLLRIYLSNIINEINNQFLGVIEDKNMNNCNGKKNQKNKSSKNNLRITIKLLFLIIVFMINKYRNIIENTFDNNVEKGIKKKNLKTNKIREELFSLIILQQNLYWINIIVEGLLDIFQKLKNNKFRMLLNADIEFNNKDEIFKKYCYECFLNLFNIVKKYSSIKLNERASRLYEVMFNVNLIQNNNINNSDNVFLPVNILLINNDISKLFECFIYEFLNDIDSLVKYFNVQKIEIIDNDNTNNNYELIYGFGIHLCEFIKFIVFIRNEVLSKIDFFNFYFFSYKLMTSYFSKLNEYLYELYNYISTIIKSYPYFVMPCLNLNYLQNLSNSLKDLLFFFMISSFNNDALKDTYSLNEILMNSIISLCFSKIIISIYFIIEKGDDRNIIPDILNILLDNVNKYKIILPLKSHFYKEIMVHNYLLMLDEFLVNNQKEIILYFQKIKAYKESNYIINNLINKFNATLSCLFNHYNLVNFLYSNHIMFQFNLILSKSGISFSTSNMKTNNIFLRYIKSYNNLLNYRDIPISELDFSEKFNPDFRTNVKQNISINCDNLNEINFDNLTYNKEINTDKDNIGFSLDDYFDRNISELFSNISLNGYEFFIYGCKSYLIKNSDSTSYSIIIVQNDGFIEKIGLDEHMKENILNIMENNQYIDKNVYKLIQEKVINPGNRNISINNNFYENIKYYDLKFEMNFFEYQNQIKELLL